MYEITNSPLNFNPAFDNKYHTLTFRIMYMNNEMIIENLSTS
jgi:hypothetical protein